MTEAERFWSKVDKSGACWTWIPKPSSGNYGLFHIGTHRAKKSVRAHRFAWQLCHGEIPDGMHVCHHCDNPRCVNPDHLFLGTRQQNMDDMCAKRRQARGSRNGAAKLSVLDAVLIRWAALYRVGSQSEIARAWRVAPSRVWDIGTGRTWSHA